MFIRRTTFSYLLCDFQFMFKLLLRTGKWFIFSCIRSIEIDQFYSKAQQTATQAQLNSFYSTFFLPKKHHLQELKKSDEWPANVKKILFFSPTSCKHKKEQDHCEAQTLKLISAVINFAQAIKSSLRVESSGRNLQIPKAWEISLQVE